MDYTTLLLLTSVFYNCLFIISYYKFKKLEKEISQLEDLIDYNEREILSVDRFTNRRIDGEIDRVDNISTDGIKFTTSQYKELKQSIAEIRLEFKDKITSGVEVKLALNKINKVESDLEDFVRMYRNQ
jgi:hypothetical protein